MFDFFHRNHDFSIIFHQISLEVLHRVQKHSNLCAEKMSLQEFYFFIEPMTFSIIFYGISYEVLCRVQNTTK